LLVFFPFYSAESSFSIKLKKGEKVKIKSLSRTSKGAERRKAKNCVEKHRKSGGGFLMPSARLSPFLHLQLIKIICENSPGTFLTRKKTKKQKQGRKHDVNFDQRKSHSRRKSVMFFIL
jgi:hypothetical protein